MMQRRQLLQATAAWPLTLLSAGALAQDKWGQGQGYPTGLQGGLNRDPLYRVGNYSGGFEKLFPPQHPQSADPTRGALHRQTHVAGVPHRFF